MQEHQINMIAYMLTEMATYVSMCCNHFVISQIMIYYMLTYVNTYVNI